MSPPTMWKSQGMNPDDTQQKKGSPKSRKRSDRENMLPVSLACTNHQLQNQRI